MTNDRSAGDAGPAEAYAWLIIKDTRPDSDVSGTLEGVTGPEGAPSRLISRLQRGGGRKFKLIAADEDPYLYGRFVAANKANEETELALAPLEDIGDSHGCTAIRYRRRGGRTYESL
jgi:hypothetical protein